MSNCGEREVGSNLSALRIEHTTLNRLKEDVTLLTDRQPDHAVMDVGVAKPHPRRSRYHPPHAHTRPSQKIRTRINLLAVLQCGICLFS